MLDGHSKTMEDNSCQGFLYKMVTLKQWRTIPVRVLILYGHSEQFLSGFFTLEGHSKTMEDNSCQGSYMRWSLGTLLSIFKYFKFEEDEQIRPAESKYAIFL